MAGCTLFGAASSRGCAGPPRCGFGSEWPSSGGPLRDANRQSWRSAHSARIVRGGGHVWDVAEMEQQLRARGFVEVETCSILPTCLGDRPPTLAGTPRTGGRHGRESFDNGMRGDRTACAADTRVGDRSQERYTCRAADFRQAQLAAVIGSPTMRISGLRGSVEALRRKLRAVTSLVEDRGATEHEKANAAALKTRLEQRLKDAGAPAGDWTDNAFRLGRWAKEAKTSVSPASPKGDWTDNALRLGKTLRRGYKRWLSE